VLLIVWLKGSAIGDTFALTVLVLFVLGSVETFKLAVYLLIGIVIIAAVLSWVNPYSPLAPFFSSLTRPFLKPFQRFIPPIANVDLSPLVLLLVLQVILFLLGAFRASAMALLA
jgi:YggT family protein